MAFPQPPVVPPGEIPPATPGNRDSTAVLQGSARAQPGANDGPQATAATSVPKGTSFAVYEVSENGLARTLWNLSGREGEPEAGRYRVLYFSAPAPRAYLLRGATQVGALPDTSIAMLRNEVRSGRLKGQGESGLWSNFWNPADPLQPYRWDTGLDLKLSTSVFGTRNVAPQFERRVDVTFTQRPLPGVITELGGHLITYGGGVYQNLHQRFPPLHDYWSPAWPWWHVAIGVPGIKWEIALADRPLPELYWLEPNAGWASHLAGLSRAGDPMSREDAASLPGAKLLREWTRTGDAKPPRGNLSHAVHVKAGSLSYSAYIDPDVYRSVVHKVAFGGMRAPKGTWGLGFFFADGVGQSLLNYDLEPLRLGIGPSMHGNDLSFSFLRLELAYRDNMRYRLGVAAGIRLDSRAFTHGDPP